MIDIFVAHAAWAPGRAESLARLRASLGEDGDRVMVCASGEKQHANVWATNVWRGIALTEASHPGVAATLVLNDDVVCHPDTIRHVETLCARFPGRVLSLHGNFPMMRQAALRGATLCRCYWPSGPAYVLPRGLATDLLAWLKTVPPDWFAGDVNEDGALASFLWARQEPTITTIPALVKHDTRVPSTLAGYDEHPNRTSWVPWLEEGIAGFPIRDWTTASEATAPYVPVPWMTDERLSQLGRYLRDEPPCAFCRRAMGVFQNSATLATACLSCASALGRAALECHLRPGPATAPGHQSAGLFRGGPASQSTAGDAGPAEDSMRG